MTKENATQQIRNTQTRSRIKKALTELIVKKGFDALTVSDITRLAEINRGTFYLHYIDKFDLLQTLEDEMIAELEGVLISEDDTSDMRSSIDMFPYDALLACLKIVCADFDFVAAISGKGGDPEFGSKLKDIISDLLDQSLRITGGEIRCDQFAYDYARALTICHVTTIINLWLERGGQESPEEVARMIVAAKEICPVELVKLAD